MNKTFIEEQQKIAREHCRERLIVPDGILCKMWEPDLDTLISQTILATEAEIRKESGRLQRKIADCGKCNACDLMMTCTTAEADIQYNKGITDIISTLTNEKV